MSAFLAAALHLARPAMTTWASLKEDELSSMPRPHGLPRVVADGPSADRILLIGSGPAAGWGVASHDLALPGALARGLRSRTGRGAIVDLIVDPTMSAAGLAAVLGGARLDQYDAVVSTVGTNDAIRFTTPAEWRRRIGRALDTWNLRVTRGSLLLMVGIQPIRSISTFDGLPGRLADSLAAQLNAITDELAAPLDTVSTTLLPALGPESLTSLGRRTPDDYAIWAREIAAELVTHLNESARGGGRPRVVAERMTSGIADGDNVASILSHESVRLEHIVTMAAAGLHTPSALVTVLGPDTQRHVARYGIDLESVPIEQSFCAVAVRSDDGLVVPDATHDPRFSANPLVTSGAVRYYAGIPIEDPHGRRIGALCVVDSAPRNVTTEAELSLLRGLAERVQQLVWTTMQRSTDAAPEPDDDRRRPAPSAAVRLVSRPFAAVATAG